MTNSSHPKKGDYALLDYLVKSCLRWLRQAGFTLICIFIIGVIDDAKAHRFEIVPPIKSGSPCDLILVEIGDKAAEDQFWRLVLKTLSTHTPYLQRNMPDTGALSPRNIGSSFDNYFPYWIFFFDGMQWRQESVSHVLDLNPTLNDFGFAGSRIRDYITYFNSCHGRVVVLGQHAQFTNDKFRTICCNESFLSETNGLIGSRRQLIGGQFEGKGENADSDGSKSGDRHAIVVKGFADLNKQERKEAIGGAIFVFCCLIIFAYAALEIWKI